MKLATLKEGGRDGTLVVVSRDLSRAIKVPTIARTLQMAIDDWRSLHSELAAIYRLLNEDRLHVPFFVVFGDDHAEAAAEFAAEFLS